MNCMAEKLLYKDNGQTCTKNFKLETGGWRKSDEIEIELIETDFTELWNRKCIVSQWRIWLKE